MSNCKCTDSDPKLDYVCGVTNLHFTGDPKRVSIRFCPECHNYYFYVNLYAHLGSGTNHFIYEIELTEQEKEELIKLMESCPDPENEDCDCSVHGVINSFERKNDDRRIVLYDDYDRW